MKLLASFVVAVALSAPVAAEDHPLRLPIAVFTITSQLDTATTYYGLKTYGPGTAGTFREVNPVYRHFRPDAQLGAMLAVDAGTIWFWHRIGQRHPKIAAGAFYALSAMRLWAAIDTIGNLRNEKRKADRRARVVVPIVVWNLGPSSGGTPIGDPCVLKPIYCQSGGR